MAVFILGAHFNDKSGGQSGAYAYKSFRPIGYRLNSQKIGVFFFNTTQKMISYENSLSNSKYKTIERIGLVIKGVYIVSSGLVKERT
jgi:hypothetical protein